MQITGTLSRNYSLIIICIYGEKYCLLTYLYTYTLILKSEHCAVELYSTELFENPSVYFTNFPGTQVLMLDIMKLTLNSLLLVHSILTLRG